MADDERSLLAFAEACRDRAQRLLDAMRDAHALTAADDGSDRLAEYRARLEHPTHTKGTDRAT